MQVSRGLSHTLALTSEGTVYAWGGSTNGQLGINSTNGGFAPVAVFTEVNSVPTALNGKFVIAIATARHTSYALCSDGTIASWGENQRGQLGNGTSGNGTNNADVRVPVAVTLSGVLSGKTVVALAGGTNHVLALCSDGTVAAWGTGGAGQLGDNSTSNRSTPVLVNTTSGTSALFGKTVIAIAGGANHSLALCSDGTVVAWGSDSNGQLGNDTTLSSSNAPAAVNTTSGTSALFGKTATAIAAGNQHSIALCADGSVVTWGRNHRSQLGDNSTTDSSVPVAVNTASGVSALFGKSVKAITAGLDGNLVLSTDGTLAGWGYSLLGQVGDNSTDSPRAVPTAVNVADGVSALSGKTVMSLAGSGSASDHFMALYANVPVITSPSEIAVEDSSGTDLMTGALIDFGSLAANNNTDLIFTIRNPGTADLTDVAVTIDGTDSALFTVTATPDSVITPAGSTTFTVRFAPVSTGLKSAALHIASNDLDENPFDISLTGTGTPEQMNVHENESNRSWRGVSSSADGVKLAAVINDGFPYFSTDSGLTWTQGSVSTGPKNWYDVASSNNGSKLVAVADGARIHTSIDSGATWSEQFGSNGRQWRTVASSADGTKLIAAANQDRIYTSSDSGLTWTTRYNNGNWHDVATSADGTKLVAVEYPGEIFTSTNSGANWTPRMTDLSRNWSSVASSNDGTKLVASVSDGQLYTSTDSGATWTARESNRAWRSVASSADGTDLIASNNGGYIYVSSDSGVNWTILDSTRGWWGVAISADGAKLLASATGGHLYTLGSAPEIAVEQPALTDLTSGGTTDFGPVLTGDTPELEFTIRNPGSETLTGLGITIDGTDSALFTLTASPTGPLTGPAGSTTFTVRFAPMSIGLKSATLHIASNDSDENPFNIVLNGTGTVPTPEIAVEQPESTDLMTGAMTDFGSLAANNNTDLIFTIRNPGTADLTDVAVTIDGTDSALFTVTAIPDSVITPAGTTTFTVRFAPVSTGLKSATLHIASNDSDENPFDISLTGTGTPEQMVARDSSSNWRGVAASADGVKLAAVITSGHIHTSTDSGATWTARPLGSGPKNWYDVASSANGTKLVAVADGARIHTSIDSGATWTEQFGSNSNVQWRSVASSADGTKLIAAAKQDRIYTSTDSGITWTVRYNNGNWNGVASSADGTKLVAVEDSGNVFTSTDSGANWTERMTDQSRNWSGVASSADGTKLVASAYNGFLYTSIDSGVTWTARDSTRLWRLVASSADGSQLIAAERDGLLYVSSDSGVNWTTLDSTRNWYGVAISADGAKLLASVYGGRLYTLGSAPEIAVEQPLLTDLTSGGTTDFGPILTGGTTDLEFTIRNPGSETLTGLGITIDGIDSALFTLTASPTGPLSGPSGSTTFTVRFAPVSIGLKSATLHIASNDSDENPFNIVLNGTGTVPTPEIAVEQPESTDLMTGAMTDFGSAAANSTTDLIFTIRNSGTANLTSVDVTVDGTDSALFTVTAIPDSVITPAGTTTFTVRFAPVSTGLKSATLHIASNDSDENPFDISLTGTGTPEQMTQQGSFQSWRGVTSSADGVKMAAVTNNGFLHTSTDSGLTWTALTALGQKSWYDVASSANGTKLVAVADGARIFTSIDFGTNWTEQFGSNSNVQWRTVASSADGTKLIAAATQDRIYTSADSGITWTVRFNSGNWHGVASSADGTKLVAVENSGNIFTSTNSGATWTARMTDQSRNWFSVASSADGSKLVASVHGGQLYTSIDSGITWTARDSTRNWRSVASSADGSQLIAAERDGLIYVSSDSGVNWTTLDSTRDWYGVAMSADGARLLASVFGGQLYTLGTASDVSQSGPNFVVTTLADNDDGITGIAHTSLREAINAANANADLSIISFDPTVFGSATTINLTGALPGLMSDLEIQGPSAGLTVRRDTGGDYRLFQVNSGTVVLRDLTLINGNAIGGGGAIMNYNTLTVDNCMLLDNTASADGGGIESFGLLTVVDSVISGNTSGAGGGGIQSWSTLIVDRSIIRDNTANSGGGGGIDIGANGLTLTASTISGNSALAGGGIRHLGDSLMTVTNSTISENTATGLSPSEGGGAIHLNANYGSGGPGATLDSNTITGNSAPNQSGGMRHGIWLTAGTLTIENTILVANSTNDLDQVDGTLISLGHNLVGLSNVSSSFAEIGDQINISSPGLGPLAENGGPTPTHALQAGSPALQAGSTALMVDQRGSVRPSGTADDIGAFELVIVPGDPAEVALGSLTATYDGNPHAISVTTTPSGLATAVTYDGNATVPTDAGSYAVVATVTDTDFNGSASGTLVIAQAQSIISWPVPNEIVFGTALSGTQLNATADVPGTLTYSPAAGAVLNAGSQNLSVTFGPTDTTNYLGATGDQSLSVSKATATVSLSGLTATYDGSPRMVGVSTTPSGLNANVIYDGGSTPPINAGTYPVAATISDVNFVGSVTGSLVVAKASSVIDWVTLTPIEYGTALSATQLNATANAPGTFVYTPTAGTVLDAAEQILRVTFTPTDTTNRLEVTTAKSLLVTTAPVQIEFEDLAATYDGNTHAVSVSTTPSGIAVNVTYDGSATVPADAGSYAVAGTPESDNYSGSGSATLVIAKAAPVITWNPAGPFVDGSALDSSALNASASIAGTFTYTPAAGATLAEGSVDLALEFVPDDTVNYETTTAERTITVVDNGLAFANQPTDQNSLTGGSVMFSVTATGADPLSYQWQKDSVDITGATSATLELTALTTADAGTYQVIVSNVANSLPSNTAELAVIDVMATHSASSGYRGGETITIENTITYTGTLSGLGWTVLLPDDVDSVAWSYVSSGGSVGTVVPGDGATELLEWAWISTPASPISFSYTISVPPAATGDYNLTAMVLPRSDGTQFQGLANPDPLILTEAPAFHTADTNGDFKISLTELLRVIELYNTRFGTTRTGRYKIQSGTEDGFAPDADLSNSDPLTLTQFHAADTSQDGKLSLTELLRIIEIYNTRAGTTRTGQYHVQSGTEDGFAPGPAE